MLWINFLHLYQPLNSEPYAIKEATEASYKRVVDLLEAHPELNFTLNISGGLVFRWQEMGYSELIERIKKLVRAGQVELTGSAAYHCLMPLTPQEEVRNQIRENTEILKQNFGSDIELKGFFLPEMAYSAEVAQLVQEEGFSWIILDEIAYSGRLEEPDRPQAVRDKNSGLQVVFRSRSYSNSYVPLLIRKELKKGEDKTVITATDGELYGFRHNDPKGVLEKLPQDPNLKTETISEFLNNFGSLSEAGVEPCNWESVPEELQREEPYASWRKRDNELQEMLWEFAYWVYDVVENRQEDENYYWARWHLIRGWSSCTFWWASAQDFAYIYGPYAWNPDEVEKGVNEFVRAIRSLEDPSTKDIKIQAEKKYIKIKEELWRKHWEEYWRK